jgi:hypothetical protein
MRRVWPWLWILIGAGIIALLVWRLGSTALLDGLRVIDGPAVLRVRDLAAASTERTSSAAVGSCSRGSLADIQPS